MSADTRPFAPLVSSATQTGQIKFQPSTTVAASTSAASSTQFSGAAESNSSRQIQISNTTAAWAYVNFGDIVNSTLTAATVAASYPVAPGTVVVVTVDAAMNAASVILSTGSGNVIFTRGDGL